MSFDMFLNVIKDLGKSQGMYGSLYSDILYAKKYDKERYNNIKRVVKEQNFKSPVDVVLFIEQ